MSRWKEKPKSALWRARKRKGIAQKAVASLLDQGADDISRYETGWRVPSLESALKLEIIYGVPVRAVLPELYQRLSRQVQDKVSASPTLYGDLRDLSASHFCSYVDLLNSPGLTEGDFDTIRSHSKFMVESFSDRYREHVENNED